MTTTTERDRGTEATMEKVFEIYIRTTPERLWEAITDAEPRSKYTFGTRIHTDWRPGARLEVDHPRADGPLSEGEILEIDPPRRLVQTLRALWSDDARPRGSHGSLGRSNRSATSRVDSPSYTTSCARVPPMSSMAAGP